MAASTDRGLSFEPRIRPNSRRRLVLGALALVLWLAGIATVALLLVDDDVLVTAFEFTGACLVFAFIWLSLAARARRRRQFASPDRR